MDATSKIIPVMIRVGNRAKKGSAVFLCSDFELSGRSTGQILQFELFGWSTNQIVRMLLGNKATGLSHRFLIHLFENLLRLLVA